MLLGAFVSNAWIGRAKGTDTSCSWCSEFGCFDYMIWRCRRSPLVLGRPPMPGCALVLRFGWIYEGSEPVASTTLREPFV